MLRVLPLSSEAVGESVVNEKIFKKTHFCEHFCLSRSTNQSVAEDGYSCDRTQISSHSKSYFVSHQELGCAVLGKKKKLLFLPIFLLSDTIIKLPQKNTLQYAFL